MLKKSFQALSSSIDYVSNGISHALEVQEKTYKYRVELAVLEETSKLLECKIEIRKDYVKLADEKIALEADIETLKDEKHELAVEKYYRDKYEAERIGTKQPQMPFKSSLRSSYGEIGASLTGKETTSQKRARYIKEIASFEDMLESNCKKREVLAKELDQ